jgi:hypothetical protein
MRTSRDVLSLSLVTCLASASLAQGVRTSQGPDGAASAATPAERCDLLLAAREAPPIALDGIAGPLAVDPTTLLVLRDRRGLPTDLAARLAHPPGRVTWQRLEHRAEGVQLSPVLTVDARQGPRQVDAEAVCRGRAERLLQSVAGTGMAPGWTAPRITSARPVLRPDVDGVAYYEFAVDPAGYVVASTGEHDRPIAQWDHASPPPSQQLAQAAGSNRVERLFKLDTLSWAAEDAAGALAAQLNALPPKLVPADAGRSWRRESWSSWQELKNAYRATYLPLLESLRMDCAVTWIGERAPASVPLNGWSPWYYWYAGSGNEQRNYDQWDENGCAIGCGPVAWAMLIGWIDQRAQWDGRWARHWGIYRQGGGWGANAIAPLYNDGGIMNVIREIRAQVGTFCSMGMGATPPTSMHGVWQYLYYRSPITVRTNANLGGFPIWYCNDALENSIKSGTPAVMGTGFLSHYPLGWQFAQCHRQVMWWYEYQKCVYVNQGWGGRLNAWVDAGTWFCGEMLP